MSSQSEQIARPFTLRPFNQEHPDIEIAGDIQRVGDRLQLSYKLTGDIAKLAIPGLTAMPVRRDELWQHSCFEFFLALKDEPAYWEQNLSPSGDWNVYRLSGYRESLKSEPAFAELPFQVIVTESFCLLMLDLDLSKIVRVGQSIEVGVTTVVEVQSESAEPMGMSGRLSYWAIAHTESEPDFHRRDSFMIQLPGA